MTKSNPSAALLVSLQVGLPQQYGNGASADADDPPWTTGFFKLPVAGPVFLDYHGLQGDGQADLTVHGGADKAVLGYAASHYPLWRDELQRNDMAFGAFGENLTLADIREAEICLGDLFTLGTARIQVSQPRQPCWKLARRWRMKELPKRVIQTGRTGWYFRVLTPGTIAMGDRLALLDRPLPDVTIEQLNRWRYAARIDPRRAAELADCPLLSRSWRDHFAERINSQFLPNDPA